jgi:hypothetical protein
METRPGGRRNSFGIRTDCERPFIKVLVVIYGLYHKTRLNQGLKIQLKTVRESERERKLASG